MTKDDVKDRRQTKSVIKRVWLIIWGYLTYGKFWAREEDQLKTHAPMSSIIQTRPQSSGFLHLVKERHFRTRKVSVSLQKKKTYFPCNILLFYWYEPNWAILAINVHKCHIECPKKKFHCTIKSSTCPKKNFIFRRGTTRQTTFEDFWWDTVPSKVFDRGTVFRDTRYTQIPILRIRI